MKKTIFIFSISSFLFGFVLGMVVMNERHRHTVPIGENIASAPVQEEMTDTAGTQSEMKLPPGHPDITVNFQKEIDARLEIVKKSPDNVNAMVELAQLYSQTRQKDQALQWFEKALSKDKNNSEAFAGAAYIYLKDNNTYKAKEYFQNALKTDQYNPQALLGLGWIKLHKENDPKTAITLWETILQHHPNYPFNPELKEEIARIKKQIPQ